MSRKKRKPPQARSPKPRPLKPRTRKLAAKKLEPPADSSLQRWSRLLTKADKDPTIVLDDARCLKPHFITQFFDLCDGKALEAPRTAPAYAEAALDLAEKTGDPHHINRAKGIGVHAVIGNSQWSIADELLKAYRQEAADCCPVCASDWLRRQGDLLVETRDPKLSREFLNLSAKTLGDALDDDTRGRILFVRGIAHLYLDDRAQALEDAENALRLLSLSTPRGYFMDCIALVGCFLQGSEDRHHYETALALLIRFRQRLNDLRDWHEVRDRLRWVIAQIEAWLGHPRRARATLERTRANHLKHSPHRYALAIAIDETLIYCMNAVPGAHIGPIRRIIKACKKNLKLEAGIRHKLRYAARNLGEKPLRAREILVGLRRSFTVPVPGLLAMDELPPLSVRKASGKG